MKKISFFAIIVLVIHNFSYSQSNLQIGATTVVVDTIFTGLDIPWEIKVGPDNDLWVTERSGLVSKINPTTKTRAVILDLSLEIYKEAEAGLLGLALHPNFPTTPNVFLVYTYGAFPSINEKVVKYTFSNNALINPVTIVDNIYGNSTHIGSRLFFLPDTTLLISTGDVQSPSLSQDITSLNGKILRVTTDGSNPLDNPSPFSPVYSYGHRNAQGIASTPSGKIFLSEHGASNDDEFQLLEADRNYGWPNVEGFCDPGAEETFCTANNVKEPLLVWTPTIAPSDLIYYQNAAFPEFDNKLLMTVLKDKKVVAIELNSDESAVISENHYLTDQFGRLRDICIGTQKEIYLATSGSSWSNTEPFTHSIVRLTPPTDLGLNENKTEKIMLYPNPSNGELSLKNMNVTTVAVYNLRGEFLKKFENEPKDINISDLPDGSYLLNFSLKNGGKHTVLHVKQGEN